MQRYWKGACWCLISCEERRPLTFFSFSQPVSNLPLQNAKQLIDYDDVVFLEACHRTQMAKSA